MLGGAVITLHIVTLTVFWTLASSDAPESLRLVQVLFRHGDRTPTDDYPTNPYSAEDWPNGLGQLTPLGMRQSRDLGRFIRTRYNGFLNSTYVKKELYVRSSDKDRTLMTASSVLAGLYPPQGFQQWEPQLDWQPIPVHTQNIDDDIEITVDASCPYYNKLLDEAMQSEEAINMYTSDKEMLEYVREHAGWKPDDLGIISLTYDPLYCMMQHPELGFVLPEWVTPEAFDWLEQRWADYYRLRAFTPLMTYLETGPFFRMLTKRLTEAVDGKENLKMLLYSSHDTMQVAILIALDLWDQLSPGYAAAIFFELHETQPNTYSVKLLYKNDTAVDPISEPRTLTIPGCTEDCPLEKFLDLLEPKVYKGTIEDWKAECNGEGTGMDGAVVAVSVLGVSFVVLLVGVILLMMKRHSRTSAYTQSL